MLEFICYFTPAFISIIIHRYLTKNNKLDNTVLFYGVYLALNNFLTLIIKNIKHLMEDLSFNVINITYCYKYLLVAIIISIVMPYIIYVISNNFQVKIKAEKNEKNS